MRPEGLTYIIRDVHGDFGRLNTFRNHKQPEAVLACGDFGFWPDYVSKREKKSGKPLVPKMHETKLYFCDGNHEDHWALRKLEDNEVYPSVLYEAGIDAGTAGRTRGSVYGRRGIERCKVVPARREV